MCVRLLFERRMASTHRKCPTISKTRWIDGWIYGHMDIYTILYKHCKVCWALAEFQYIQNGAERPSASSRICIMTGHRERERAEKRNKTKEINIKLK